MNAPALGGAMATPARRDRRRVLVAGAAGFLGRSLVAEFAAHGWEVHGLVRNSERAISVTAAGGVPVLADLLDAAAVERAAVDCSAIVHVAANPSVRDPGPGAARRARVDGCRNLLAAARAAGVPRLVIGSGYWVYADQDGEFDENGRLDPRGESAINYATELAGREGGSPPEVMVVRPGMVYGDGSWFRGVVDALRSDTYRLIEGGRNPWSFVGLADAAAGFRTVVEVGRSGEVYNLVDLSPTPWGEFIAHVAGRLGAAPPGSMPMDRARRELGEEIAYHLSARRAASSARLRSLGWAPRYPSYRAGIDALLASMGFGGG